MNINIILYHGFPNKHILVTYINLSYRDTRHGGAELRDTTKRIVFCATVGGINVKGTGLLARVHRRFRRQLSSSAGHSRNIRRRVGRRRYKSGVH